MLGLIFGTRAGETSFEPFALILPRFLLALPALPSLLSARMADGVLAVIGDSGMTGLSTADPRLIEAGVLRGPSLGVFRAESRGAFSSVVGGAICVLI